MCQVNWDAFSAAYEKLMEILSEDEAQQAEMEAREQEVGELEDSLLDLSGKLADLITLRGRERDQQEKQREEERAQQEERERVQRQEERVQREKQEEKERVQRERQEEKERAQREKQEEQERVLQEKHGQVTARRLRLTSLYKSTKEKLSRMDEQLGLPESPSAEQLKAMEDRLVVVRCDMLEANKLAQEVAGMVPDDAEEVFESDTAETSSYDELEHQVLMKLNKLKALYPQLSPTAATPTPTSVNKAGHFRFERRSLPKFRGALRDYPTFKADWISQVAPSYDEKAQLYELRGLVPEKVKVNVENFTTIEQFWTFMDDEFGNKDELVRDRLKYLKEYKHPKDLRSDAQKFHGMFSRFNEVYSDRRRWEV